MKQKCKAAQQPSDVRKTGQRNRVETNTTTEYPSLFDSVPVGIYRTTPTGQLLDANLTLARMLGLSSREEVLSIDNTTSFWLDPEERRRWRRLMEQEGGVFDFEFQICRRDGTVIWVKDTAQAIRDPQGQVLYYEGTLEDISEYKRMEQALHSSEALTEKEKTFFEALILNIPTAVIVINLEGQVITWNPAAERLFGYAQEEAIGRDIDDLVATQATRAEAVAYSQQATHGNFVRAITQRGHKDGSLVDVELLAVPVIVEGQQIASLAIYHDITELQRARQQAEAANHAKSVFLANMSHELRTPLNAILGFSELMTRDPNLTQNQRENLEIIGRSGEHLLNLINDVLNLTKIESGRLELHPEDMDLTHMLLGIEEMFRLHAENKGLTFIVERDPAVPQYIRADQGKLRQVLINLLSNAIKFTPEGGIMLRIAPPASLPPTSHLHFEVRDSGVGIAAEEIDRLFEAFVQTQSGRESREGTGLGLPISRRFVQLMGGEITVHSQVGHGTTIGFDIPIEIVDAAVRPSQIARRVIGLEPGQPTYRILVADDKEFNRQLLVKLLTPLGFELREAADGQQAVEIWEEWSPHLIWMDMRMPVMDGYQATQRIKSTTRGQATVIIALTASVLDEDQTVSLSAGCDDFMRKPFREAEILASMNKHLGVRYVYDEPSLGQESAASQAIPSSDQLAELDIELLENLRQAVINLDTELFASLIDRIRGPQSALADSLTDLINNYEYERISVLIEKALAART